MKKLLMLVMLFLPLMSEADDKMVFKRSTPYNDINISIYKIDTGAKKESISLGFKIPQQDFNVGLNMNKFNVGIQFDKKVYYVGDKKIITRRPRINASYKNTYDFGWFQGSYKITGRWINPKKLMYNSEFFPKLPLTVEDQGSEIQQRVFYIGLHAKF